MVVTMASSKSRFSKKVKETQDKFPDRQCNSLHFNRKSNHYDYDPEIEDLEVDAFGLFSICFKKEFVSNKTYDEITEEFSAAGDVVDVHLTESFVFVRFEHKEELQNCFRLFKSTYKLRIAKCSRNEEGSAKVKSRTWSYNNDNKSKRLNGPPDLNEDENGWKNRTKTSDHQDRFSKDSDDLNTEVFAANIEDEETFKESIQRYQPKAVKFIAKGFKKFAFISMRSPEDAATCIRDLDQQMQSSRVLCVRYNCNKQQQRQNGVSCSDSSSLHSADSPADDSPTPRNSRHSQQNGTHNSMPKLETDYTDLPPLVKDSEISDPDGRYNYDCGVLVTDFPSQTLESELRGVFKDFNVLDICVINNGFSEGCTRAMVYMGTLYQAVEVIQSKRRFVLHDHTLKVIAPTNNVLLKKILMRIETNIRDC